MDFETANGENYITIKGVKYVIIQAEDYVNICLSFIEDGKEMERLSRAGRDVDVLDVLKFYSEVSNYLPIESDVVVPNHEYGLTQRDLSMVSSDSGIKAREIIALLEE